jgi:hypothetical protein
MAEKIILVCPECNSHNITRDACAWWNVDTQEWEMSEPLYDVMNCADCGYETKDMDNFIEAAE